jgi:hypothetical protein
MLDPPRSGIVLSDLGVALAANLTVETDGDRGGARRAFVEAQDDLVDVGFQARFRLPVE